MKRLRLLLLVFAFLLSSTSCSGYNSIMREHLGNEENYYAINATFDSYAEIDDSIYLYVSTEERSAFDISETSNEKLRLELVGHNCDTLRTFLAEEIHKGDTLAIKCSTWIYMDSQFYYVAEIRMQDKTILSFEDGLQNIIAYICNQRSLF